MIKLDSLLDAKQIAFETTIKRLLIKYLEDGESFEYGLREEIIEAIEADPGMQEYIDEVEQAVKDVVFTRLLEEHTVFEDDSKLLSTARKILAECDNDAGTQHRVFLATNVPSGAIYINDTNIILLDPNNIKMEEIVRAIPHEVGHGIVNILRGGSQIESQFTYDPEIVKELILEDKEDTDELFANLYASSFLSRHYPKKKSQLLESAQLGAIGLQEFSEKHGNPPAMFTHFPFGVDRDIDV